MPTYTQTDRSMWVETTAGEDVLLLTGLEGSEGVSSLFHYRVQMISEQDSIDFTSLLRKSVTVGIQLRDSEEARYINGRFSHLRQLHRTAEGLTHYEGEIVPWLWFLTLSADCRIFQNKSVPDIIQAIFNEQGFTDYENQTTGTYSPRDYCVQYRETDFNFISRLMEEEGIFYYFRHEEEKHTMVLVDKNSSLKPCPGQDKARFEFEPAAFQLDDTIHRLSRQQQVRTGQYTHTDYNYTTPKTNLEANEQRDTLAEVYDYPGNYESKDAGSAYARVRLEEQEVLLDTIEGTGNCRAFTPGYKFDLQEHYRGDLNKTYVLTSLYHRATQGSYRSGERAFTYENSFTAIPFATQFRPPRTAVKPTIRGTQTAVVTGPGGEEIYTDQYGRVKVQFHWDRAGTFDEKTSCWIRVSYPWAGKNWGMISLPRIGHEVVVSFLEGDPDRPLITGAVYNAENMPPYALPDMQTISTTKSLSSKGGGGFNEIRFEDKKGSEQIFVHGEKDLHVRIKNDEYRNIDNDMHLVVKNDRLLHIKANQHFKIDGDQKGKIGGDNNLQVMGKQTVKVSDSNTLQVTGDVIEKFNSNHSEETSLNYYLKALQIVIEAATGITLKVGGSSVVIDPSGVSIAGPLITLAADGFVKINSGPGSSPQSGSPGSAVTPADPDDAKDACDADPGKLSDLSVSETAKNVGQYSTPDPPRHKNAAQRETAANDAVAAGNPPPQEKPPHFVAIKLKDKDGNPVAGEPYKVTLPDGSVAEGTTDDKGEARIDGVDPGQCKVTFPRRDKSVWKPS